MKFVKKKVRLSNAAGTRGPPTVGPRAATVSRKTHTWLVDLMVISIWHIHLAANPILCAALRLTSSFRRTRSGRLGEAQALNTDGLIALPDVRQAFCTAFLARRLRVSVYLHSCLVESFARTYIGIASSMFHSVLLTSIVKISVIVLCTYSPVRWHCRADTNYWIAEARKGSNEMSLRKSSRNSRDWRSSHHMWLDRCNSGEDARVALEEEVAPLAWKFVCLR